MCSLVACVKRKAAGLPMPGPDARRGNGTTDRALHLIVIPDEFEPQFSKCRDERPETDASLYRYGVVVTVYAYNAIEACRVHDGTGCTVVAVGRSAA